LAPLNGRAVGAIFFAWAACAVGAMCLKSAGCPVGCMCAGWFSYAGWFSLCRLVSSTSRFIPAEHCPALHVRTSCRPCHLRCTSSELRCTRKGYQGALGYQLALEHLMLSLHQNIPATIDRIHQKASTLSSVSRPNQGSVKEAFISNKLTGYQLLATRSFCCVLMLGSTKGMAIDR